MKAPDAPDMNLLNFVRSNIEEWAVDDATRIEDDRLACHSLGSEQLLVWS
jgi:hypothetical protein